MNDIVNRSIVLKLNSNWQRVGYGIVADAIVDLVGGESVVAIDFRYEVDENGDKIVSDDPPSMIPIDWATWLTLPIRPWDEVVHSPKLTIRVPTVVIAKNFHKMPTKDWKGKPSNDAISIRDGRRCQYTGKILDRKDMTVDHVLPRSRGGRDTWENLVLTSKELNSKKGNSLNHEIGLKLIKQPKKPGPVPISQLIQDIRHPDWQWFFEK
jgi:5-methylcytosine-specific restriction endonuclease McrA